MITIEREDQTRTYNEVDIATICKDFNWTRIQVEYILKLLGTKTIMKIGTVVVTKDEQ